MKVRVLMVCLATLLLGASVAWLYRSDREKRRATVGAQQPTGVPTAAVPIPAPPATASINPAPAASEPAAPAAPAPVGQPDTPARKQAPSLTIVCRARRHAGGSRDSGDSSPAARQSAPPPVDDLEAAAIQFDQVNLMLRDYRTLMGENPFGTNAEIMKAIMGGNPRGARLGPPPSLSLNGQGELVDRWGTPYFFHQMSATNMEIRSAGPDRTLWTPDDVTQP